MKSIPPLVENPEKVIVPEEESPVSAEATPALVTLKLEKSIKFVPAVVPFNIVSQPLPILMAELVKFPLSVTPAIFIP